MLSDSPARRIQAEWVNAILHAATDDQGDSKQAVYTGQEVSLSRISRAHKCRDHRGTHIKVKEKYIEQADVCELAADAVDDWDCAVGDADEGNDMGHQRSEINDEE
ncbi:hypothetical protein PC115_g19742 [Phytophthora cactorum]|uniref:Uncharacterized protein n=1 Tax=Phytophthora cactorum TaxID=29920 RepID=A0A8T1AXW0_9STRA|nr:hypothetical protein PC115_g19742 [Phytophthora cactorum]KAG2905908.1 hypothetical protein PC117_g20637 [Phytophthora cactorum]